MNKFYKKNRGFTLVETMFAVIILTSVIVGLMTVVSQSLFAARYARDEVTVNYLMQEVIDTIRNDRDTTVFLADLPSNIDPWATFTDHYLDCADSNSASGSGCYFDVLSQPSTNSTPQPCSSSGCPILYYDKDATNTPYYTNDDGLLNMSPISGIKKAKTNFKRKIVVTTNGDEMDVVVSMTWINGGMTLDRQLKTSFLKWQQ